ncbi:MAG: hypothetical protein V8T45_05300 [Oscillospiraceae bacterium]
MVASRRGEVQTVESTGGPGQGGAGDERPSLYFVTLMPSLAIRRAMMARPVAARQIQNNHQAVIR